MIFGVVRRAVGVVRRVVGVVRRMVGVVRMVVVMFGWVVGVVSRLIMVIWCKKITKNAQFWARRGLFWPFLGHPIPTHYYILHPTTPL